MSNTITPAVEDEQSIDATISRLDDFVHDYRHLAYTQDEYGVVRNPDAPEWLRSAQADLALWMLIRDGQWPTWWRAIGEEPDQDDTETHRDVQGPGIDEEQATFLERRFAEVVQQQPRWALLSRRLLAMAGRHVVVTYEEDLEKMLERGRRFAGPVEMRLGEPNRCHSNSAKLWADGEAPLLVTGWALSEDGLWRQHSWCAHLDDRVVETTVARVMYFGFTLISEEARRFADANQS